MGTQKRKERTGRCVRCDSETLSSKRLSGPVPRYLPRIYSVFMGFRDLQERFFSVKPDNETN